MAVGQEELAEVPRWTEGIGPAQLCIAGRFVRPGPRRRPLDYLLELVSSVRRKIGWQMAEQKQETPGSTGYSVCALPTAGMPI